MAKPGGCMRNISKVLVNVFDFGPLLNTMLENIKELPNMTSVTRLSFLGPWGYIRDKSRNTYIISALGDMSEPLDKSFRMKINILPFADDMYVLPSFSDITLTTKELGQTPVKEVIRLDEFILDIGEKSVIAYNSLNEFFTKNAHPNDMMDDKEYKVLVAENSNPDNEESNVWDLPEEVDNNNNNSNTPTPPPKLPKEVSSIPFFTSTASLSKYGSFLVLNVCSCETPKPLLQVGDNTCTCGNKRNHYHCKTCGGIIKYVGANT